jgi:hypothetical protein
MTKTDARVQALIGRASRGVDRRSFLSRAAGATAAAIATLVVGPLGDLDRAYADHGTCFPPRGVRCAGCSYEGNCPTGYTTCTPGSGCSALCPYSRGYWFTGSCSQQTLCRDCIRSGGGCTTTCGCASKKHYNNC